MTSHTYTVQDALKPSGLKDISDNQIEQHWSLYKGYVTNVNGLMEDLKKLEVGSRAWSELKRRAGFEFSGMVLHEYYFGNLIGGARPKASGQFASALERTWGNFDTWKTDMVKTAGMRGIGWAILYHDPMTDQLMNWWANEHEDNHPAGFSPILVLDVFEHAYMVDHGAAGRADYIKAFFENVNWDVIEHRYADSKAGKAVNRFIEKRALGKTA